MKQTRIRLFGSVLMIIIIPMALFILGIWKNSDSYLTTQVLISGIAVLVIVAFSMAFWVYGAVILPLERLEQAMREIKNGNFDAPLDAEDVSSEMRGLMDDFEEMRLRLKENREEKEKADSDAKEFLSNITHDLKTPITSIKGYVEGIQDGVASSPEQMDRYIRTIYNKANEMDHLIDELTFYTKIDSNRIPYHFAIVPAAQFFRDCAEDLRLETEARSFRFLFTESLGEDVRLVADAEQMRRVINNIISNSIKYCDKEIGEIRMRVVDDGDFVRVELSDNGPGIASRQLPYVFERFFRADEARNFKGGSGIGLSIVKKIIEDHGGRVWARSVPGKGMTILFSLRKHMEDWT